MYVNMFYSNHIFEDPLLFEREGDAVKDMVNRASALSDSVLARYPANKVSLKYRYMDKKIRGFDLIAGSEHYEGRIAEALVNYTPYRDTLSPAKEESPI